MKWGDNMKQNVVSLNTLFKYYQIVKRALIAEFKQNNPQYQGWIWFFTVRSFKQQLKDDPNAWTADDFVEAIANDLSELRRPTARTEKIKKILGL